MRDAFGGSFMIKLMLIFLAIYISFVAVALNYAKAFRVKNSIIDIIEQNEGIGDYTDNSPRSVLGQIDTYLNTVSYYVNLTNVNSNNNNLYCYNRGYCIEEFSSTGIDGLQNKYYKVTTYIKIDLPFFGLNFPIAVTGETRKIERII